MLRGLPRNCLVPYLALEHGPCAYIIFTLARASLDEFDDWRAGTTILSGRFDEDRRTNRSKFNTG